MTLMRFHLFSIAFVWALLAGAQSASAQGVQDFQLPPNPTASPSEPAVQGPVDDSGIIAQPPRAVNTPQPQPTATNSPVAEPTPQPSETAVPASPSPVPSRQPQPTGTPNVGSSQPQVTIPDPLPTGAATPSSSAPGFDFSTTATQPTAPLDSPSADESAEAERNWIDYWPWAAAILLALAALIAWFWFSRKAANAPPPEIERPVVAEPSTQQEPVGVASPQPAPVPGNTIGIKLEAVSLSRSMMNLTLNYSLAITNRTLGMVEKVEVFGDLASVRSGTPVSEQVANASTPLASLHSIARLSGKQTKDFTGKLTLPVSELHAVRPGEPLYVPLLRIRLDGQSEGPMFQTYIVGMLPTEVGGKLQPFRVDEQPQTYSQIGMRLLD